MVDTPIVSETLQSQFRTTFPSQITSGRDLHVSDVIIPIVDFSTVATGSTLSTELNNAIDYSMGNYSVTSASSSSIITTTGFFRVVGSIGLVGANTGSTNGGVIFEMNDGTTDKIVFQQKVIGGVGDATPNSPFMQLYDFICYIHTNHSLKVKVIDSTRNIAAGTTRQVADINGNATKPLNFVSE